MSEFLHACRTDTRRTCGEARANLSGVVEIDSESAICSLVSERTQQNHISMARSYSRAPRATTTTLDKKLLTRLVGQLPALFSFYATEVVFSVLVAELT